MTDFAKAFEQARTIVDERLRRYALRRQKRAALRDFGRASPVVICAEGLSCGGSLDAVAEKRRPRSGSVKLHEVRSVRLPEGMRVPPAEPRLPDLKAVNLSFAARLVIAVRDKFNGEASKVYTAAKVSRQAYSQIISDETRPVGKRTAVRFAFALHSTPKEARLLLKSAGYAFSNSRTEDFILQACLEVDPPIWDLDAVNALLREYRVDFQY